MREIRGLMRGAALREQLRNGILAPRPLCPAERGLTIEPAQMRAAEMVREIGCAEAQYLPDETHKRMIALLP